MRSCTIHANTDSDTFGFDQKALSGMGSVSLAWVGNIKLKCKDCREEYMPFNFNMEESKGTGYVSWANGIERKTKTKWERTNLQKFKYAGGGVGGMMKRRIVRHTTKTQERYTRRHFYTNCIFLRLPGEKHQIQEIKEWVGNKVCNWVTKQIYRRVFSNGLWRRECHNVRKRICRIICKWVTRVG